MAGARLLDSARAAFALAALSLLCLTPAASANFDSLPSGPLIADGAVQAIAVSGENVYLGGSFQTIGPRTGQGVLFNSDLSSIDSSIPQVSGGERKVDAVVSDGKGGWYVGGEFSTVGGVARKNIAHILANDTVDPSFHPEVSGVVHELALSESGATLFIAGEFKRSRVSPGRAWQRSKRRRARRQRSIPSRTATLSPAGSASTAATCSCAAASAKSAASLARGGSPS